MSNQPFPDVDYQGTIMVERDQEHLKVLSICWYVGAGLSILFGFFPLIYVVMGAVMVVSPASFGPGAPPGSGVAWVFIIMGATFSVAGFTMAILGFITAWSLPKRRRLWVAYAAAGLCCLQIPIGTVLGIFTFIILSRPQVRASFT